MSFFITYIVSNGCWETRIAQRTDEGYFTQADALREALLTGSFPADIREKFRSMLEYFGQSPIIVRSSSFLEDGFGNAFAGKYKSVFCVNQGTPEERLEAFEEAVRTVYASTMDLSALEYRKQRGLQHSDEQMAVLVQRVSGSYHGDLFFPAAAGVGYSYSSYRMNRWRQVWFTTCQGLLENRKFTGLMQSVLKKLDQAYGNPVDIEYTVNLDETGAFVVNLLQCRPLYTGARGNVTEIPQLPAEDVFFHLRDSAMGSSTEEKIDVVLQIDAKAYYEYPYALKPRAADAVGAVNAWYRGKGKNILFMTPGRVGTSSPELGVPVSFAQISGFRGICEVSDSRAGYMPELSYGSHMFQDLVEAGIFYCALWGDDRTAACRAMDSERLCRELPEVLH